MGSSSNFMAQPVFFLVLSLLLIPAASTHLQSREGGYISVLLSDKGIDFAKDVLINKAVSTIIPLQLPDIEKRVKIPLLGRVRIALSGITIYNVTVASSYVETGETGITLVASGGAADLSMKWEYSYSSWIVVISDDGDASVQVKGMEVVLTVALQEEEGALKLSVLDCGCKVKDISIQVDGGASWLYQGLVDAFEKPIGSTVEKAISKKIRAGILKLDSQLQSLPKQIRVDHTAALNVTFVADPVLVNSSIEVDVNGSFTPVDSVLVPKLYHQGTQASLSCNGPDGMIGISLLEKVFNTAALVYFNAGFMHWKVDRFSDQSLLNTAAWKIIYPQLYNKYPDDDMNLYISITSPPAVKVLENGIDAAIYIDVTVNVVDAGEVIPVACVSLVVSSSGSPQISGNRLAGILELKDFTMSLKWSNIGDLQVQLVQPLVSTILQTIFIPFVNSHLMKGFPLPLIHGFTLENAEIHYAYSKIVICSNLAVT